MPPPQRQTPSTAHGHVPPPQRQTPSTAHGHVPPPQRQTPSTAHGHTPAGKIASIGGKLFFSSHSSKPTFSTKVVHGGTVNPSKPAGLLKSGIHSRPFPAIFPTLGGAVKRDIQLIAVVDNSVTPPQTRYMAKIVPESTALIESKTLSTSASGLRPSHVPASTQAAATVGTLPKVCSGVVDRKSQDTAGTSTCNRDPHIGREVNRPNKAFTFTSPNAFSNKSPPVLYVCDHAGCKESFQHLQLLNLHKSRIHGTTSRAIHNKNSPLCNGLQNTGLQASHGGSKQVSQVVSPLGGKRLHSYSSPEESTGVPHHKIIKLDTKAPCMPAAPVSGAPVPQRNFARKSTGGLRVSRKRKRIAMKQMHLKLKKISIVGLKVPKVKVCQGGVAPKGGGDHSKPVLQNYKNLDLFRNHIRSQLNLPASSREALLAVSATPIRYVSTHQGAESTMLSSTTSSSQASGSSPESSNPSDMISPTCARVVPFASCARTEMFDPEKLKLRKQQSERESTILPATSVSTGDGDSCQPNSQPQSEDDEHFPLVFLSPMVPAQPPEVKGRETPNLTTSSLQEPSSLSLEDTPAASTQKEAVPVNKEGRVNVPSRSEQVREETDDRAERSMQASADRCSSKVELSDNPTLGGENREYTLRLLQTIAKLSGDADGERSRR